MNFTYAISFAALLGCAALCWLAALLRARYRANAASGGSRCPFHLLFGKGSAGKKPPIALPATGLGWHEDFLDGSAEAEAAFINKAMDDIHEVQARNKAKAHDQKYERAFHAKIQAGVTNAVFCVRPDLPASFSLGFFQPGARYNCSVRLSNAAGVIQSDTAKDLRGIAIRVRTGNGEEHDYLATNGNVNHARNARQFIQFAKAAAGSRLLMLPRLIASVGIFETIRMLRTVIRQTSHPVVSLATETYWSRAPYLFGTRAFKFQLTPQSSADLHVEPDSNYLRSDIVQRLKHGPVVFDFQIQLYGSKEGTPIEDGSVEWDTPLITIAQLLIPQQDLTTPEAELAQKAVENLEFNPWNTSTEFRPLGSLNRARRLVYQASVRLRKGLVRFDQAKNSSC